MTEYVKIDKAVLELWADMTREATDMPDTETLTIDDITRIVIDDLDF